MLATNIFFYLIAITMVVAAVRIVTTKNVVHAAMYLVLVLGGAAAQYVILAAEYVASAQVLVYIGAVVVLVLFGVMLTRARIGQDLDLTNNYWYVGLLTSVMLVALLGYTLTDAFGDDAVIEPGTAARQLTDNTGQVSDSIFATYLVPFEAVSLLLTAALVGAIVLARKD